LLSDHLGSLTELVDSSGGVVQRLRYMAWGEDRYEEGAGLTDNRYTGQRKEGYGLYFYQARWYDPALGRFAQADTKIPIIKQGVQAWDRYAYVNNSPTNLIDKIGHDAGCPPADPKCTISSGDTTSYRSVKYQKQQRDRVKTIFTEPNFLSQQSGNDQSGFSIHDTSSCSTSQYCFQSWEQPRSWDTDPRHPDYTTLAVSIGSVIGGTVQVSVDRYGTAYLGVGLNIGKSITKVVPAINGGHIGSIAEEKIPGKANLENFLTGWAVNGQFGIIVDIGITWSPFANDYIEHHAYEIGGVLPFSSGLSVTYSTIIVRGK